VAQISVNLAMTLRIEEPKLSDIERAALLHNLGRLALPDPLLSRDPGSFSAEERARFRSYPLHGQAMLKNVPFLAAANQIAVATHERYDGTGFPRGLAEDDIPLGACIVAVADAYDEMVSGSPPVSPARAIEILSVDRIAQFNPVVVGALVMLYSGETLQNVSDARALIP
jgi:response regulator RpfG family c-di-GMP phosphodiesterase